MEDFSPPKAAEWKKREEKIYLLGVMLFIALHVE